MRKNSFKKFITTNPWLKLASFIIAVGLWFFVVSEGRTVVVMDIPVVFKNVPVKLQVVSGEEIARVSVKGYESALRKLRVKDIAVTVDLTNVKKGLRSFSLSRDNVMLPKALTITDILPRTVKLMIEEKVIKDIQVRPTIVGVPAEGYLVKKIDVTPKTVRIEGPDSAVAKVYTVRTDPIDITGITESLPYIARLDTIGENIVLDTMEVEVNITLNKIK